MIQMYDMNRNDIYSIGSKCLRRSVSDLLMLRYISRGLARSPFAIEKKLFVYDAGIRDGTMDYRMNEIHSGIRATVFGATGSRMSIKVPWDCRFAVCWAWQTAP